MLHNGSFRFCVAPPRQPAAPSRPARPGLPGPGAPGDTYPLQPLLSDVPVVRVLLVLLLHGPVDGHEEPVVRQAVLVHDLRRASHRPRRRTRVSAPPPPSAPGGSRLAAAALRPPAVRRRGGGGGGGGGPPLRGQRRGPGRQAVQQPGAGDLDGGRGRGPGSGEAAGPRHQAAVGRAEHVERPLLVVRQGTRARTVSGTRTPGQLCPARFFFHRWKKSWSTLPSASTRWRSSGSTIRGDRSSPASPAAPAASFLPSFPGPAAPRPELLARPGERAPPAPGGIALPWRVT